MPSLYNIKLQISYDGSSFFGWQKTAYGPSIEESLENGLAHILKQKVVLQAASRTDRGVHARGQIVQFFTDEKCDHYLQRALNAVLPKSLRVLGIEQMHLSFHPTLDAKGKEYSYHVYRGAIQPPHLRHISWHIPQELNRDAMEKTASLFIGKHDFSSLCNVRKKGEVVDKESEIFNILFHSKGDELVISVFGKKFLYKMVRNIVGTLIDVGRGKMEFNDILILLNKKDRTKAGMTAPAHALFLNKVIYD